MLAAMGCAATIHAGSVKLAWNANPETDIAGYKLSYGTSPGVHTQSQTTGKVTTTTVDGLIEGQTYYFVLRAVNTSGLESQASSEISHAVPLGNLLAKTDWRLRYVDSEAPPSYGANLAFDGNPATFWHTAWTNGTTPPPHEIQIDLGREEVIAGFRYLPRQDNYNVGSIANYAFHVSLDGTNWGNPVASGTFDNTKAEKEVLFASVRARYIRLRQLSEANGYDDCSVAEISIVRGTETTTPPPPENRAPVATAGSMATNEDTPAAATLAATDADGDPLTYQIVTQPLLGSLGGTAPNLTYTPRTNANGSDSFTFRVSDGKVTSATATVSITVRPVNDAPVASAQSVVATAGTGVAVTLRGTDIDSQSLTYEVRSQPTQGVLTGTAPNLTYTPYTSASGTDSFTFRVSDGSLTSNTATVSISVTAAAAPPPPAAALIPKTTWTLVSASSQETTGEDGRAINAIDGDPDTFWHSRWSGSIASPPHELRIDLGKSESIRGFRYLPRQDGGTNGNIGRYEFHVSNDGINWGSPVASGTFANDQTEKEVLIADISGRHILLRAFNDAAGNVYCAVAELSLIQGESTVVQPQENRAPVASNGTAATDEDKPVSITLAASDPDNDSLEYEIVGQPSMGTLSGTAPNLTYTPAANANGSDSFSFRVGDGNLQSSTATVSITVRSVNDVPVASGQPVATNEDGPVGVLLYATDTDGNPLVYRIVNPPSKGRLGGSAPNLTYTPNKDFHGSDSFTFIANDGTADSAAATVSITVNPVNDTPQVMARMVSTPSDTPAQIILFATDPDGDSLAYRIVSQPMKGKLSGTAPGLTYTPNPRVSGSDSFSFRVNDGTVDSSIATVFISLTEPLQKNQPPVFTDPKILRSTGTAGSSYTCTPLEGTAIDPEGDLVAYEKSSGPTWLTVAPDGAIGGTPPEDVDGLNSFTIRARDPEGAWSESVLEIEIEPAGLPLPWTMQRMGTTGDESDAHGSVDSLALTGSGKLSGKSDSGLLVWQTLTGDGDITARVSNVQNADSTSRIGMMIRETPAPDSKYVFIGVDSTGYLRWMRRTRTAANPSISAVGIATPNATWLRLTRAGGTIRAFTSADGNTWSQVGSVNVDLGSSSYIGLFAASGSDQPASADFNNVSVTP